MAANNSFENDDASRSSDSIQPIPPVFTEERRAHPLSADVVGLQALNCMCWCSAARTHGSPRRAGHNLHKPCLKSRNKLQAFGPTPYLKVHGSS